MNSDWIGEVARRPLTWFLVACGAVGILSFAWLFTSVGIVFTFIFGFVFVLGVASVPLFAYVVGPSLPGFAAILLATAILAGPFAALRQVVLEQTEDNDYRFVPESKPAGDKTVWGKFAFATFGIAFEATDKAFESSGDGLSENLEPEGRLPNGEKYASSGLDRGGEDWYVELRDAVADGGEVVSVKIGQALAPFRGAAGIRLGEEALTEALKNYGADTAGISDVTLYGFGLVFFLIGAGFGYMFFV